MEFGKRRSGVGATAQTLGSERFVAQRQDTTETSRETPHPFRAALAVLVGGVGLYFLIGGYAPDLLRDHRLSGTWQPAYDLRAIEGKCRRTNFVITFCDAKIASIAKPDQTPFTNAFVMLFAGGGGEALVPVRSTRDRTAVSIQYAAETMLWNRTLSLVLLASATAAIGVLGLRALVRTLGS